MLQRKDLIGQQKNAIDWWPENTDRLAAGSDRIDNEGRCQLNFTLVDKKEGFGRCNRGFGRLGKPPSEKEAGIAVIFLCLSCRKIGG